MSLPLLMTLSRPWHLNAQLNILVFQATQCCRYLIQRQFKFQTRNHKFRPPSQILMELVNCEGHAVLFRAIADRVIERCSGELSQTMCVKGLAGLEMLPIGCLHPAQPPGPCFRSSVISNVMEQRKHFVNLIFLSSSGVLRWIHSSQFLRFFAPQVALLTNPSRVKPCRSPSAIWPRLAWGGLTP